MPFKNDEKMTYSLCNGAHVWTAGAGKPHRLIAFFYLKHTSTVWTKCQHLKVFMKKVTKKTRERNKAKEKLNDAKWRDIVENKRHSINFTSCLAYFYANFMFLSHFCQFPIL